MILRDSICVVNGKMHAWKLTWAMRWIIMQEKVGAARTIGYAIGIAAAILVVLWRLMPHIR
jgi:hypothetical protein